MTSRTRVYVQVQNKVTKHWKNEKSADTYENAVKLMNELKTKWPEATFRVLDPNLYDHTK